MVEYGYINENGYLVSRMLQEHTERFKDDQGNIHDRTITVEEQGKSLALQGWKPVDVVDSSLLNCEEEYYSVHIQPTDLGDHIGYTYVKAVNQKEIRKKIDSLTEKLSSTNSPAGDYKIIKCYEASLLGKELPYDMEALHLERQNIRNEINRIKELQIQLTKKE